MEVDDDELPVIDIRREDDNESLSSARLSSSSSNPDESTALRRTISCAELGVVTMLPQVWRYTLQKSLLTLGTL